MGDSFSGAKPCMNAKIVAASMVLGSASQPSCFVARYFGCFELGGSRQRRLSDLRLFIRLVFSAGT